MTCDCPMQLVLYRFKKSMGDLRIFGVVNATLFVDISYFEVESALTGPDLSDAIQKFIEIILSEPTSLLQAFIIQYKAFNNEFAQHLSGPDSKLGGLIAIDPVTDCNDCIKVVKGGQVTFPIGGSCFHFGNNSIFIEL